MKKVMLFLALSMLFVSCEKDPVVESDYFKEPVLDWTLNKAGVKSKETRTLIADRAPSYYVWISNIFEGKGSGGLEFGGEIEQLKSVNYDFFSNAETLVQVSCEFVVNSEIATTLMTFMKKKYGSIYEERNSTDEQKMIWTKPNMTITYTKNNYYLTVMYRKNPLK